MNFMNWLNDNLIIAGVIGIVAGIIAKYIYRGYKNSQKNGK